MARIFISHNSQDAKEAAALKRWLTDNGWDDTFLDIDAKDGLSPGERWKDALKNAADRCEAVLCLVSPTWLASAECKLESRYAETLRKHLFLALIKPCNTQDLPPDWQWCPLYGDGAQTTIRFDFREQPTECSFLSDGLERLKNGLQRAGISAEHFPWPPDNDPDRAPYRGLKPLEAADAAVFFGRNAQILDGMETLGDMRRTGIKRLLVILGASGSGKSSFMRAGLLPRLARDDRQFYPLPVIRPRNAVLYGDDGLASALASAFGQLGGKITLGKIEERLNAGSEAFDKLLRELEQYLLDRTVGETDRQAPSIVIPIDQAEELFNPDGIAEAELFLTLLAGLLAGSDAVAASGAPSGPRGRIIVVLTIRSDRYERLQTAPGLSGVKPRLFDLRPFPPGQFERVINGPAERVTKAGRKLAIDSRLTERLLVDFSEGTDTLPLLGFTLEKLYLKYGSDGDLTLEEYEGMRGSHETVQAAIFQEAINTALQEPYRPPVISAEQTAQYDGLRRAFIPFLARINPVNNEPMRQMAKLAELPADIHPLVERLVEARLLIRDKDAIEVAHESLLRQWSNLRGWLIEELDKLRLRETIRHSAADWKKEGERKDLLVHRNGRLKDAEVLLAKPGYVVSADSDERVYLNACTAAQRVREAAEKEEQERRIRDAERIAEEKTKAAAAQKRTARATLVGLAVAVLVAGLASWQWRRAEIERNIAEAQSLASQADLALTQGVDHLELSALLAIESMKREPLFENHSALRRAVSRLPMLRFETGSTVWELAFSADGRYLTTQSTNGAGVDDTGSVRVFELETGKEKARHDYDRRSNAIALTPNGRYVAMANADKVQVFELPLLTEVSVVDGEDPVLSLLFDPTGRTLAIGSDKSVRIVEPASGKDVASLQHQSGITPVAFSPRGQYLAGKENGTEGRNVWIFEAATGKEVSRLVHEQPITAVAFSPSQDGEFMATGSGFGGDAVERFFGTATGEQFSQPIHYQDRILTLAFSPDNVTVASGSLDHNLRLWDVKYEMQNQATITHRSSVNAVAFSPDGRLIATGSGTWGGASGGDVRVFAARIDEDHKELADFEPGGKIWTVAFSGDGRYLAAGVNGEALVYSAASIQKGLRLASENGIKLVAFGPDASQLAALASDGAVSVVETATGKERARFTPEGSASTLVFSPNGRLLAMASNKEIWIQEAATGKNLVRINHDGDVRALAFTPDGSRLAAGIDKAIQLWEAATGKESTRMVQDDSVGSLAFSPDGHLLAAGTDKDFRVMEAGTGKERMRIIQNGKVDAIAFSPDGEKIAIDAKWDAAVRMFDLATGKERLRLMPDDEIFLYGVDAISFSPDGRYLDIAQGLTQDRVMLVPDDLMDEACSRVTRNLTFEEWKQYLGASYQKTCPNRPCPSDLKTAANGSCVVQ